MKKQAILIALIILSSLSISAQDIVVINSENGEPIVGAKVFTENDSLISNRYGKLINSEITSVDFVTYNNIHLNSTLQNDTLIVDFPFTLNSPKKMGRLEGKVMDQVNNESIGRLITLYKNEFYYKTFTDANGDFIYEFLSKGKWRINIDSNTNYKAYRANIEIDLNNINSHNITLESITQPKATITGSVVDMYGNAVINAFVEIMGTNKNALVKVNSKYEIKGLTEGKYKIKVSSLGYFNNIKDIHIGKESTKNIDFQLTMDSIIGEIRVMSTGDNAEPDQFIVLDKKASGGVTNLVTSSSGVTKSGKGYIVTGTRPRSATPAGGDLYGDYPKDIEGDFSDNIDWSDNEVIEAGQLTSGEVNDFRKWEMWADIAENKLNRYIVDWGIEPTNRYTVQLTSLDNRPVIDAKVNLINQVGKVIWSARSDNTGKAELWADAYSRIDDDTSGLSVEVFYKGKRKYEQNISSFKDGINFIQVDEYCAQPNKVDILFAMDATGSMSDEIDYLKTELLDIIEKLEKSNNEIDLRIGSLFYRDYDYSFGELLTTHDLTNDIASVNEFINSEVAISGNSIPEAVDVALSSAVNEFTWSDDAIARIMFLILDAPPHRDANTMRRFTELTAKAAEMGIRIIPLTASGIDKSTEYLMRSLALLTNGTYVFLTDDSGIGKSHIEPTTDSYDVEMMNEMIVRIINQFIDVPACGENNIDYAKNTEGKIYNDNIKIDNDISKYMKIYPNPTDGPLTLSLDEEYDNLFLVDMNGKILFKIEPNSNSFQISLANYPSGAYFLKYSKDGVWGSSQIQLIR